MYESWLFWAVIFCAAVGAYFLIAGITLLLHVVWGRLEFKEWESPDPTMGLLWPLFFLVVICISIDWVIIKAKNLFNNKKHNRVG